MTESFAKKIERFKFNLFPAYRRGGARITYISNDYHEIHVKLPLNWTTKNYVGGKSSRDNREDFIFLEKKDK